MSPTFLGFMMSVSMEWIAVVVIWCGLASILCTFWLFIDFSFLQWILHSMGLWLISLRLPQLLQLLLLLLLQWDLVHIGLSRLTSWQVSRPTLWSICLYSTTDIMKVSNFCRSTLWSISLLLTSWKCLTFASLLCGQSPCYWHHESAQLLHVQGNPSVVSYS